MLPLHHRGTGQVCAPASTIRQENSVVVAGHPLATFAIGAENLVDSFGGTQNVVGAEFEHRGLLRPHLLADRRLDATTVFVENLENRLVTCLAGQGIEKDNASVELGVNVDRGDGDEFQALVVDLGELVGDDLAEQLIQARFARIAVRRGRT